MSNINLIVFEAVDFKREEILKEGRLKNIIGPITRALGRSPVIGSPIRKMASKLTPVAQKVGLVEPRRPIPGKIEWKHKINRLGKGPSTNQWLKGFNKGE